MEDVDLAICSVGAHYVLLDGFSDTDSLDEVVEFRERISPLRRRDDLDDARLHTVGIDSLHLCSLVLECKVATRRQGDRRWGVR